MWAGVDVGGRRKGFHVAAIDGRRVVLAPVRVATAADVVELLRPTAPVLVAVDSPIDTAADGHRSRPAERALARAVCGIRYTPAAGVLATSAYYEWIIHGLELYAALRDARMAVIECFPTASWTRWAGARGSRHRAPWTRDALAAASLDGVPRVLSQDGRDALGAALTAHAHSAGRTECFGPIVVPITAA